MSLKAGIAKVARSVAYASGLSAARARSRSDLRILMLHGVGAGGIAVDDFEQAMEYLRRDFEVIPLDRMVGLIEGADGPAAGQVALTFDDGYRNNVTLAYPILARLQLPATIYVCPGLIERQEWLWNHDARERLRTLAPRVVGDLARELDAPGESIEALVKMMKGLQPRVRLPIQEEIRRLTPEFDPTAEQREAYDTMSWDDLASLSPDVITIGSHTMNHHNLSTVDEATLDYELIESRRELEQRLGRPVEHFCYPNNDRSPRVIERARALYRSAAGGGPAFARPGGDTHLIPRIPMPPNVSALAWRLDRIGA